MASESKITAMTSQVESDTVSYAIECDSESRLLAELIENSKAVVGSKRLIPPTLGYLLIV